MTSEAYKHVIETLEKHYGKGFAPTTEGRKSLLNKVYDQIKGCEDKALMAASESLMLNNQYLPNLARLIEEVKKEQMAISVQEDNEQKRRADNYRRGYGKQEPLSQNMKNVLALMTGGKITRREFAALLPKIHQEAGGDSHLGPHFYLEYVTKLGKPLDEPAFSGGIDFFGI